MIKNINKSQWKFSPTDNIFDSNFNKLLERFYNMGISGLVRENIQNSLDGRLHELNKPVIVTINTGEIATRSIPGINDIIARIKRLEGRNSYTRETIEHMKNKMNQTSVNYISFEDENTKGLTGAKNGQSNSNQDTWGIYAYNTGVHSEESDEEIESARGGSHGVGKIASNAASDIHTMYFANCDCDGNQHIGGTVQLIEHNYDNAHYRSTGYFTKREEKENSVTYYPYENTYDDIFTKRTRGLKVIVPYLRDEYNNEKEIVRSVCDGFFLAILQGNLEVIINGKQVKKETIQEYINNENYYDQPIPDMKKNYTPLYLNTYLNREPISITVTNNKENFEFQLFFDYNEEITKGRVAIIRTIGMKIEDFKVPSYANRPYNAVLLGGNKEDAYLKSLENESHTALSSGHIKDRVLKRNANKFIKGIGDEVKKIFERIVAGKYPPDAKIDTSDSLYLMEMQLKKDLEKKSKRVKLSTGGSVVQTETGTPQKERRDRPGDSDNEPGDKSGKRKRDPLKTQKGGDTSRSTDTNNDIYSAEPETVERIILGETELLKFDFRNSKKLSSGARCNLLLSVVDGMGKEINESFIVRENYDSIYDVQTGEKYSTKENKINNIPVSNGMIELELQLTPSLDRALKFIYYVEVQNDL